MVNCAESGFGTVVTFCQSFGLKSHFSQVSCEEADRELPEAFF